MYVNVYILIFGKLDKSEVLIRDYCNKFSDNFALLKTMGVCLKNLFDY